MAEKEYGARSGESQILETGESAEGKRIWPPVLPATP
jgi:hypothetical protein